MPALAALAQDLALILSTPSVPATAICTARGQGLAVYSFHMHIVLSGLFNVKCDVDGKLNRIVLLYYAAKEL